MKTIDTLIEDIHRTLIEGINPEEHEEKIEAFGKELARVISQRLVREKREGKLRMSNIGKPCLRQLYYEVNNPEEAEPLTPSAYLKFLYGDIIEELLIFLADISGHRVEGRQDTQVIAGIEGHRDVVLDGVIVDVKSASPFGFEKFKYHKLKEEDPFGYYEQMQSYLHAGKDDPIVLDKNRGAFLAIDKVAGHLCLDIYEKEDFPIEESFEYKKKIVSQPEPPARGFDPIVETKYKKETGNLKLPFNCGYCAYMKKCWPEVRTFISGGKPTHYVHIEKQPAGYEVGSEETDAETDG